MSRWPTAACFISWLALCPDNDVSGGRVLWKGVRLVNNRAGQMFRIAASSLHHSQTQMENYLCRMQVMHTIYTRVDFGSIAGKRWKPYEGQGCQFVLSARKTARLVDELKGVDGRGRCVPTLMNGVSSAIRHSDRARRIASSRGLNEYLDRIEPRIPHRSQRTQVTFHNAGFLASPHLRSDD